MWKKLFVVMSIISLLLLVVLSGGLYYAYTHRQTLTEKVMAYAMENIGGSFGMATSKSAKVGNKGSAAVAGSGLENMLGSLLNNQDGDAADLGQMAQRLLSGLNGGAINANDAAKCPEVNDINARDSHGRTLLMNICRTDVGAKVVKMVLRYGADVDAVDEKGRTALMYAVALNQNPEVVALLVDAGADVRARDYSGKSVRQYVVGGNNEIKALLRR